MSGMRKIVRSLSAGQFTVVFYPCRLDEVPVKLFNEILFLALALTDVIDPDSGRMVK